MAVNVKYAFAVSFTLGVLLSASVALLQWQTLISSFGVPLEPSEKHYVTLPRTKSDAEAQGWYSISNGDCTNKGVFNGHRYIHGNDWSLTLLFDKNGYIAGVQANPLRRDLLNGDIPYPYPYWDDPFYYPNTINGHKVFSITTYFVYPGDICSRGRDPDEYRMQGTGTQLYFQNGPTPCHVTSPAPREREHAYAQKWNRNMCFTGMGNHNYYDIDGMRGNNCTSIRPQFLLYSHSQELHGFGYAIIGVATANPGGRFEYPTFDNNYGRVGPSIPDCLHYNNITTFHFWLVDEPWKIRCP